MFCLRLRRIHLFRAQVWHDYRIGRFLCYGGFCWRCLYYARPWRGVARNDQLRRRIKVKRDVGRRSNRCRRDRGRQDRVRKRKRSVVSRRRFLSDAACTPHHANAHGQQCYFLWSDGSPRWAQVFELRHSHAAKGNSIRKMVPRPTSVVKSIDPLWSCTMRNVLANPMPLPPGRVVKNN